MNSEQNELLATMDTLQIQLDNAESVKIISDTIATERLNDVMILQQRNEELLSVNKQLKQKVHVITYVHVLGHVCTCTCTCTCTCVHVLYIQGLLYYCIVIAI